MNEAGLARVRGSSVPARRRAVAGLPLRRGTWAAGGALSTLGVLLGHQTLKIKKKKRENTTGKCVS